MIAARSGGRLAGVVGAFVALWCAAVVVAMCGVLLDTGLRGAVQPQRYADVPIVVAADQLTYELTEKKEGKVKVSGKPVSERVWLDRDLVETIAAVDGVAAAVPDVTFGASMVVDGAVLGGPDGGPSWGHGWGSAAITSTELSAGAPPAAADEVAIDAELAARAGVGIGDVVTIASTAVPADYLVAGIVTGQRAQSSIYFSDTEAERLSRRPGQAVAIAVTVVAGASHDDVAAAISSAVVAAVGERQVVVHTGADRGQVEHLEADRAQTRLISLGAAIGGTSVLVAILVVAGTFTIQLQQRRRELALLRAVAATPRQIRRMVAAEAAVIGSVAGVLGAAAGTALVVALRDQLVDLGIVPRTLPLVVGPAPALAAAALAVLAGSVSALVAVRRGARIAPTEALVEASAADRVSVPRTIAGTVVAAGYVALLGVLARLDSEAAATPVTFLSVVLAAIAVALLGPLLTRLLAAATVAPMLASRLPSGHLAAESLYSRWSRAATTVTPLCLAVAMTCTALLVPATLAAAAAGQVTDARAEGYVVSTRAVGLAPEPLAELADVDGVVAVTAQLRSTVRVGLTEYPVQGLGADHQLTLDLGVVSGAMTALDRDGVAVSERFARDQGVTVGDDVEVTFGDRTTTPLRVDAVYASGLGFGDLTLTYDLLAAHVDDPLPRTVFIATEQRNATVQDQVAAAVEGHPGGATVLDAAAHGTSLQGQESAAMWTNLLVMAPIVAFALVGAVNAVATATVQRRPELALLSRIGAVRVQLLRALRWEAIAVALIGAVLGVLVAVATVTAYGQGMAAGAGASLAPRVLAGVAAAAIGAAVATTALAGRRALRPG